MALKPGKTVEEMIKNVMQGKDEGADNSSTDKENAADFSSGIAGRVSSITLDRSPFFFFGAKNTMHKKNKKQCKLDE